MSQTQEPVVSFVIPVRDDAGRLEGCLASIRRSDYPADRIEIIVTDNGSRDESAAVARQAGAVVLDLPNLRVGELRNRGATVARGELLAFVDADHQIDPGWVRAAVEILGNVGVTAAGALCDAPYDGTWVQRTYDLLRRRAPGRHDVEWLGSGNLAMRRSDFLSLRGFDTSFETCEDVDLCARLRAAGGRIVSDDRLRSIHFGDPATLGALFRGELWRGRDNLRASFRTRPALRQLPSALIPIIDLLSLGVIPPGLILDGGTGHGAAVVATSIVLGLAALRACRMSLNAERRGPDQIARALAVALTYDLARALALVVKPRHHRSDQVSSERA